MATRLRDLMGYRLNIRCAKCGCADALNLQRVAEDLGWEATLEHVKARLTCAHCGSRLMQVAVGGYARKTL